MNGGYVTVVGNVTAEPVLRETKNGRPFATFQVASTARRYDPGPAATSTQAPTSCRS
ncbi:MAG: single-stranded DNA-binding protein [Actinomycetales bacterium]|nr:single-stranded DNA-binding protein [Actinomycetales bacterium]